MSRKNHQMIDGRLLQTDKPFSQLKQKQKEKINEWLYQEYRVLYRQIGKAPDARHNNKILFAVYEKIEAAEIWIPLGEVEKYFFSRKTAFRKRYEKELNREQEASETEQH